MKRIFRVEVEKRKEKKKAFRMMNCLDIDRAKVDKVGNPMENPQDNSIEETNELMD